MSNPRIDLIATIRFLSTDEGGRHTPAVSGYRGQFYYDGRDWCAAYTFSSDPAYPGETLEAMIFLMNPESHIGKLHRNKGFEIREGAHVVAQGMITWVHLDIAG